MDRWEKEYLDIIERQKDRQANAARKTTEGRVQKGWKEIVREDGTKWYIPDEAVLSREERKQQRKEARYQCRSHRKNGWLFVVRKILIRFVVVLLIWFLIVVGLFGVILGKRLNPNFPLKMPSVSHFIPVKNTYANGLGLRDTITTLFDIRERQVATLNSYLSKGSFSMDEITAWQESIVDDLVAIENLRYDKSYADFVDAHKRLLNLLQEFIDYALIGDNNGTVGVRDECAELLSSLSHKLTEALDANGVEYIVDDDSIHIRFDVD